jgi:branched-chain amino acid transport system substrate-binding protein
VVEFVKAYKEKYNKEPDAFAALGYDSVQILVQAIKDAGEADPVKIKDALSKIKDFQGITGKMSIDAQHNPVKAGVIIEFKDGVQVMKTRIEP